MRAILQRVESASVTVDGICRGAIDQGLLVFLAIHPDDTEADTLWMLEKLLKLRVFDDGEGRMNLTLEDTAGGLLLISQFTLYGTMRKGTRPSFHRAAPPQQAQQHYEDFARRLAPRLRGTLATGVFGAHMLIAARHDGPVTLVLDSHQRDF